MWCPSTNTTHMSCNTNQPPGSGMAFDSATSSSQPRFGAAGPQPLDAAGYSSQPQLCAAGSSPYPQFGAAGSSSQPRFGAAGPQPQFDAGGSSSQPQFGAAGSSAYPQFDAAGSSSQPRFGSAGPPSGCGMAFGDATFSSQPRFGAAGPQSQYGGTAGSSPQPRFGAVGMQGVGLGHIYPHHNVGVASQPLPPTFAAPNSVATLNYQQGPIVPVAAIQKRIIRMGKRKSAFRQNNPSNVVSLPVLIHLFMKANPSSFPCASNVDEQYYSLEIHFYPSDSPSNFIERLRFAFQPCLNEITTLICFKKIGGRNSKKISKCEPMIPSGNQLMLENINELAVAPFFETEIVPRLGIALSVSSKCFYCKLAMDQGFLQNHLSTCEAYRKYCDEMRVADQESEDEDDFPLSPSRDRGRHSRIVGAASDRRSSSNNSLTTHQDVRGSHFLEASGAASSSNGSAEWIPTNHAQVGSSSAVASSSSTTPNRLGERMPTNYAQIEASSAVASSSTAPNRSAEWIPTNRTLIGCCSLGRWYETVPPTPNEHLLPGRAQVADLLNQVLVSHSTEETVEEIVGDEKERALAVWKELQKKFHHKYEDAILAKAEKGLKIVCFNRQNQLDDMVRMAQDVTFFSKMPFFPVFVEYPNEEGSDSGGLALDYFDNCNQLSEQNAVLMDDYLVNKEPRPVNADGDYLEGFDDQSLKLTLKAFGLFDGGSFLHTGLARPHIWKLFRKWEDVTFGELNHPYIEGLSLAGVLEVFKSKPFIRVLFKQSDLRSKDLVNRLLLQQEFSTDCEALLSYSYFLRFLVEVEAKRIFLENSRNLELKHILKFLTGSETISCLPNREAKIISVRFARPQRINDELCPVVSTCLLLLTLPYVESYETMCRSFLKVFNIGASTFELI